MFGNGEVFEVNKVQLETILKEVHASDLRLPDFQREWVWPVSNVISLLESIIYGHPIGSAMLLESGGNFKFQERAVEGAPEIKGKSKHLILDAQQRITTLYQSTFSKEPARIKGGQRYYFFLDYRNAQRAQSLDGCIIAARVDANGKLVGAQAPYTDRDYQFENGMFPFNEIFDSEEWQQSHDRYWYSKPHSPEQDAAIAARAWFAKFIVKTFNQSQIPVVTIKKTITAEGICSIYTKLNSKGVPLDPFSLLIAMFAAKEYNLRNDWHDPVNGIRERLVRAVSGDILSDIAPIQFVHAVSFLCALEERRPLEFSNGSVLSLDVESYKSNKERAIQGFARVGRMLQHEGVYSKRLAPPAAVILTLSVICAHLGKAADSMEVQAKLKQWLWTVMYKNSFNANSKIVTREIQEVIAWTTAGGAVPTVIDTNPLVDTQIIGSVSHSPTSKAVTASILRKDAIDFATGKRISIHNYTDRNHDDHHLYPQKWCKDHGIPKRLYDSPINKTPMSSLTNKQIGSRAPSEYLALIESRLNCPPEQLDEFIRSHAIDPEALRSNDFMKFFESRSRLLLKQIEDDIGRPVLLSELLDQGETEDEIDLSSGDAAWPETAEWRLASRKCKVYMKNVDGSLYVVAGSVMSPDHSNSLYSTYLQTRKELVDNGQVVVQSGGEKVLLNDYPVNSVSAAASIFTGYTRRGRWIDPDGVTGNPDEVADDMILDGSDDPESGADAEASSTADVSG